MTKEIKLRSVKTFIEAISPFSSLIDKGLSSRYVFRGQGNSNWELLPTVFRSSTKIPIKGGFQIGPKKLYRDQLEMEWSVLRDFIIETNNNGFHIPNEKILYRLLDDRHYLYELNKIGRLERSWPSEDYFSLLSLAQHFGLPTRLLDWTYNAYTAAYFAAIGGISNIRYKNKPESIAVYALNIRHSALRESQIELIDSPLDPGGTTEKTTEFHVVRPPTYFNENLKAQQGLFTCTTVSGNIKNLPFSSTSIEVYLSNWEAQHLTNEIPDKSQELLEAFDGIPLYKFMLPSELSYELLMVLDELFVNSSSLFPGLRGCAQTLFERCIHEEYHANKSLQRTSR